MSYCRKKLHIKERETLKSSCPPSKVLFSPRDVTILTTCLTTLRLTLYPWQLMGGRWARPHHEQECLVIRTPVPLFTPKPHVSTLQMEQGPLALLFVPLPSNITRLNNIFPILCCYLILIDILGEGGQVWLLKSTRTKDFYLKNSDKDPWILEYQLTSSERRLSNWPEYQCFPSMKLWPKKNNAQVKNKREQVFASQAKSGWNITLRKYPRGRGVIFQNYQTLKETWHVGNKIQVILFDYFIISVVMLTN